MNRAVSVCSAALLACCGCTVIDPIPPQPRIAQFSTAEYLPYDSVGTASISGQAFAKTAGGEVRYAAGNDVFLSPVTSYSHEWWQESVIAGRVLTGGDEREQSYIRTVIADGEGRFNFRDLPRGDYYVFCELEWQWGGAEGQRVQVHLGARVQVADGEHRDLILVPVSRRNNTVEAWLPLR